VGRRLSSCYNKTVTKKAEGAAYRQSRNQIKVAVKVGHTYNQKQHGAYGCEGNAQFHEYAVAVPLLLQTGDCLWPAVRLTGITHVLSRLARTQRQNIQGNSQRRRDIDS
jgi:hypothetical protein